MHSNTGCHPPLNKTISCKRSFCAFVQLQLQSATLFTFLHVYFYCSLFKKKSMNKTHNGQSLRWIWLMVLLFKIIKYCNNIVIVNSSGHDGWIVIIWHCDSSTTGTVVLITGLSVLRWKNHFLPKLLQSSVDGTLTLSPQQPSRTDWDFRTELQAARTFYCH